MREPGEIAAAFPRPGRALKTVLALIALFAVAGAVVLVWTPGGERGAELFKVLAFEPRDLGLLGFLPRRPWTLITSGILTVGFSHALWSLVGVYFLTTDLERRWGGARTIRFLLLSVLIGNLTVLAASFIPHSLFRTEIVFGPLAAITATAIAWSKENAHRQIRFMFFLPMSGRVLFWVTIGLAVLAVLFGQNAPEGAVAPFGGVIAGVLLSGAPSPLRSVWLRIKLLFLRRGGQGLTVESITRGPDRPRSPKRSGKGPPLRVVYGGLEEDLKNRKPPKDKRYLN